MLAYCKSLDELSQNGATIVHWIKKVVRGDFIIYFNKIFDALCKLSADSDANVQSAAHLLDRLVKDIITESDQFSIEEFMPLLRERMNVLNPYVRQFLVGWITVLDIVPDIDMLGFLPDFLDGLFNMLSDSSHEIRQQADAALSEFLQEINNSPINEFVKLGGEQLVPYYADILCAILPCISDEEEKIRVVARETNEELCAIKADPTEGFDIGAILSIAKRFSIKSFGNEITYKKFEAEIYVLTKDEGGRHTAFVTNYSPQFYFRTADVTGRVELLGEMKMVLPGDNVTAKFELISPVPLEPDSETLDEIVSFVRQILSICVTPCGSKVGKMDIGGGPEAIPTLPINLEDVARSEADFEKAELLKTVTKFQWIKVDSVRFEDEKLKDTSYWANITIPMALLPFHVSNALRV
ncbi:Protein VAC14-like protein [Zea mays]|uniref:Protein VAC14-like protein n=1 Tax=Zea mays TaxID=4577 RepID=A0A1D6KTT6_MAIZE|nr:Protein VAC14-like protein [Zea mays]